MSHPIFIGGTMRTGTTLLRALLGQHPRLFAGLETQWMTEAFEASYQDLEGQTAERMQLFFDVDAETYAQAAAGPCPEAFLDALMNHCMRREGKQRWIEKTPWNVFHLERIVCHWPQASFLHCVRNPLDVYASWKRDGKPELDAYFEAVAAATRSLHAVRGKMPVQTVRYEDLVRDAEAALREVCAFLGEDFVPGIEKNSSTREGFEKVKKATGKESTVLAALARPVFTDSVGQYTEILELTEVTRIRHELAGYIETYYPDRAAA